MSQYWLQDRYSKFLQSARPLNSNSCRYTNFSQEITELFRVLIPNGLVISRSLTLSHPPKPFLFRCLSLELPSRHITGTALYQSEITFASGMFYWQEGRLDATLTSRLTNRLLLHLTTRLASNSQAPPTGTLRAGLEYGTRNSNHVVDYSSVGQTCGWKYCRKLGSKWHFGHEIYYTAAERSGGMSVGLRYGNRTINDGLVGSCIINPIMGNFRISLATLLTSSFILSSYYTVNVHSYDSDVGAAIWYRRPEQFNHGHNDDQVKLVFSTQQGIKLLLTTRLGPAANFAIGLGTGAFNKIDLRNDLNNKYHMQFGFLLSIDT